MSTTVTIELTDEQVAMLRGANPWRSRTASEILGLARAALPPEPLRLTVELPQGLADQISRNVLHVPDDAAVDLWRHVERAIREAKKAGVPVA